MRKPQNPKNYTTEPPDGGWGWMVVLGSSLVAMTLLAPNPSFGLLFDKKLEQLGEKTTGAALIYNVQNAALSLSGLLTGPLMAYFTCRQVTIASTFVAAICVIATAWAPDMIYIILIYSVGAGVGMGLCIPPSFLIINAYFCKRRGLAVGISKAGTALGFIFWPLLISYFCEIYGFQDALVLVGALGLNAVVGAALFQPVQWHVKKKFIEEIENTEENAIEESQDDQTDEDLEDVSIDKETQAKSLDNNNVTTKNKVTIILPPDSKPLLQRENSYPLHNRRGSIGEVFRMSNPKLCRSLSIQLSESSLTMALVHDDRRIGRHLGSSRNINRSVSTEQNGHDSKLCQPCCNCLGRVSNLLGLHLLRDIRWVNILLGLSLTSVAETSFLLLFPFLLSSKGISKQDIAMTMAIMAGADVITRLVVPVIIDLTETPRRIGFLIGCVISAICRSGLAEVNTLNWVIAFSVGCGIGRATQIVNQNLTIAEYVSTKSLPAALGLNAVTKGIMVLALGPLIGVIRDATDSYRICFHIISGLLLICALTWTLEGLVIYSRKKRINDATNNEDYNDTCIK